MEMTEVDHVRIAVITDNYFDALRPDPPCGVRYRTLPGQSIHAEHGLSYYVETVVQESRYGLMFDYGVDPRGVANNMALLDIDLARVRAFGLSHGHFDHWGGLLEILRTNGSKIPKGIPFYVGQEVFAHRLSRTPDGGRLRDLGRLDRTEISQMGLAEIVEVSEPVEVIPGAHLTGKIERTAEYETDNPMLLIERDGSFEVDDFRGEQALFFKVKGKGLVVLSGCAHTGIINTVKQAQRLAGVDHIYAVIGGFHLVNATPQRINLVVEALKAIAPDHVIPTHCTGFEATMTLCREMPEQFRLNTAGTTYVF
ncbi:MAG TPA: hypothetical protein DCR97_00890 [Deltaproteobacteria bacterium]|nr:hypothetical protein [Deltaproteobacteria bacterium]